MVELRGRMQTHVDMLETFMIALFVRFQEQEQQQRTARGIDPLREGRNSAEGSPAQGELTSERS